MTPLLSFKNVAIVPEGNEALADLGQEHDQLVSEFDGLQGVIN